MATNDFTTCPNCGEVTDWEMEADFDYHGNGGAWMICVLCFHAVDVDEFYEVDEETRMRRDGFVRCDCEACGTTFWGRPNYGYCDGCADKRELGLDVS